MMLGKVLVLRRYEYGAKMLKSDEFVFKAKVLLHDRLDLNVVKTKL